METSVVSPSSPQLEKCCFCISLLLTIVVIGLRKPYIKAVVGTGLELIFIDKTFSVVVVRGHSNTLFPLDDEEVRLLLMAIMRLELQ